MQDEAPRLGDLSNPREPLSSRLPAVHSPAENTLENQNIGRLMLGDAGCNNPKYQWLHCCPEPVTHTRTHTPATAPTYFSSTIVTPSPFSASQSGSLGEI